jgi:sn-glycerol 3-phosphate transport system permease protein
MVENRPWMTAFYYVVLTLGVLIVAFPLYITFIASTLTMEQVLQAPMPLLPGDQFINNYTRVLTAGSTRGSAAPVGQMMINSFVIQSSLLSRLFTSAFRSRIFSSG